MESTPEDQPGQLPKPSVDLPAKDLKTRQDDPADTRPQDQPEHHGSEAKTYGILALWMLGDLLLAMGYQHTAIWILVAVFWTSLSVFTFHAVKVWLKWKITLCLAYAILCVSAPVILFFSRSGNPTQSTSPAFSVEISSAIPSEKLTNFFLLWNVNDQANECLSPINAQWAVQITNLKEIPLKIKSYQFEGQTAAGNWEVMQTIDPRYGNIIFRDGNYVGIFYPEKYGLEHFFPQVLEKQILESGIPITGFTYLETSQKISDDKIRLRIFTPAGEYVEPAIYNPTNHLQTQIADGTLSGFVFFAMTNDISKVPVKSYADFPYK